MTLNWATQVSFDPKWLGIGVEREAFTHELIAAGGVFTLCLIDREDRAIVRKFTKPVEVDLAAHTLNGFPYLDGPVTGAPVLAQSVAYVECEVRQPVEVGNHTLFLGEVVNAAFLKDEETRGPPHGGHADELRRLSRRAEEEPAHRRGGRGRRLERPVVVGERVGGGGAVGGDGRALLAVAVLPEPAARPARRPCRCSCRRRRSRGGPRPSSTRAAAPGPLRSPAVVVVIVTRLDLLAGSVLPRPSGVPGRGAHSVCLLGFGHMTDTSAAQSAKSPPQGGLFHSWRYVLATTNPPPGHARSGVEMAVPDPGRRAADDARRGARSPVCSPSTATPTSPGAGSRSRPPGSSSRTWPTTS